ncbi:MAG: ABC transporter permease [Bacillati bacterium ANGP1]|uniref:ABC transporter permease n=1 Tax=Candidatus Segetimicrobium genomatis TaxID=2569760 RepID=A0A537LSU2_9BACT|nr:MAG: ABC transporter permease [Terrabacteria group bacterium ANGP1]
MARFLLRRLGLVVPALWLVSALIFALAEIVPGDVARTVLGPYATPDQVAALRHQLGADRPLVVRYAAWLGGFVTGNWGDSLVLHRPVRPFVFARLVIPVSLALGVLAGLHEDRPLDRVISLVGLSLTAIPEFVSGVILLVVLGVQLRWFPIIAQPPPGVGPAGRIRYLALPAIPIAFVLFGYIARMARAGMVDVMGSAYIRTAVLKGLPPLYVITHHALRNALLPAIAVIGSQIGWLVGGLVVVETLFTYPGLGKLIYDSALAHDVPVLEATALLVAAIFMLSNLAADAMVALLQPRVRSAS